MRKLVITLSLLLALAGSAALGLRLTPWLATQLNIFAFRSALVPPEKVAQASSEIVRKATSEVLFAADSVDNIDLLNELVAAKSRGVKTTIVISGIEDNRLKLADIERWLSTRGVENQRPARRIPATYLLVDGRMIFIVPAPIDGAKTMVSRNIHANVVEHPVTYHRIYTAIIEWMEGTP